MINALFVLMSLNCLAENASLEGMIAHRSRANAVISFTCTVFTNGLKNNRINTAALIVDNLGKRNNFDQIQITQKFY
jgi:hypothetical protein